MGEKLCKCYARGIKKASTIHIVEALVIAAGFKPATG